MHFAAPPRAQYSKSHRLTCVTLEGDIIERKGGVEGGWVDKEAGRLVSEREGRGRYEGAALLAPALPPAQVHVAKMYAALEAATAATAEIERLKDAATAADQAVTAVRSEEARLASELLKARDMAARLQLDVDRSRRDADAASRAAAAKAKSAAEREAAAEALRAKLAALAEEAASEFSSSTALSAAEEAELAALAKSSEGLKARVPAATREMQVRVRPPAARRHAGVISPPPSPVPAARRLLATACPRARLCSDRTCACARRRSPRRSPA